MIFGETTARDDLLLGSVIVLVLVVVLVLEKAGLVTKLIESGSGVAEPWMPGGEPLHHVATLSVVSRRLPRTFRRVAVLSPGVSIS